MILPKTTVDKSLKFMSKANSSQGEHVPKNGSSFPSGTSPKSDTAPFQQKQNFHKIFQKFIGNIEGKGFRVIIGSQKWPFWVFQTR